MAKLKAQRAAQSPLYAEFVFNMTDTMKDIAGVEKKFSAGGAWDIAGLPGNAVVHSGDITVETASNDTAATQVIDLGDPDVANRYVNDANAKAAARVALVPTGYRGTGKNLRMTIVGGNGDATAGKISVRVAYTVTGRATEQHAPV